jgi:hypothetical protein
MRIPFQFCLVFGLTAILFYIKHLCILIYKGNFNRCEMKCDKIYGLSLLTIIIYEINHIDNMYTVQ